MKFEGVEKTSIPEDVIKNAKELKFGSPEEFNLEDLNIEQ